MTGLLAKKKDGKMAYKVALLSQDYSLQVIHKTGRIFTETLERSVVAQWERVRIRIGGSQVQDVFCPSARHFICCFVLI